MKNYYQRFGDPNCPQDIIEKDRNQNNIRFAILVIFILSMAALSSCSTSKTSCNAHFTDEKPHQPHMYNKNYASEYRRTINN